MRELTEPKWAVISERGCEAAGLNYEEAIKLERRLKRENVHGLCIVTDTAARRMKERTPVEAR
ncbi:MAG: hypothetical protein AUG51_24480 [Acidobacteria bacterium 13_1_20CM_3_53_8]|nr:MAG: hypothetical protein AUG51_24480 [Acidobacteria bacterium 13_1_20CM_3_53_8]